MFKRFAVPIDSLKAAMRWQKLNTTDCEKLLVKDMPQHCARKILRLGRELKEWEVVHGDNNAKIYRCPEMVTNPTNSTNRVK